MKKIKLSLLLILALILIGYIVGARYLYVYKYAELADKRSEINNKVFIMEKEETILKNQHIIEKIQKTHNITLIIFSIVITTIIFTTTIKNQKRILLLLLILIVSLILRTTEIISQKRNDMRYTKDDVLGRKLEYKFAWANYISSVNIEYYLKIQTPENREKFIRVTKEKFINATY